MTDDTPKREARDALSRMIARMTAQRRVLDHALGVVANIDGVILELGLGKARTYDRLRSVAPQRRVIAFDREVHCPPVLRPPDDCLVIGEFDYTLPAFARDHGACAALVHADIGTGDASADRESARRLAPLVVALMRPGAIAVSDRPLPHARLDVEERRDGEAGIWPYYLHRLAPPR